MAVCSGVFAVLGQASFAESEPVELVDKSGTRLTARLISSDGKTVKVLRDSDKKSFAIPMERLDEGSSKRVQEWIDAGGSLSQIFEIDFATQRNRKTTAADDYDDKRINMEPVITLKNPDPVNQTQEGTVSVIVFGRPIADTSNLYVFNSESFDLTKIAPLASAEFRMDAISSPYDDRGYAKFGARYLGYAVLVHNKDKTQIYSSKSVPETLLKNWGLRLLKLESKKTYTKDLKPAG